MTTVWPLSEPLRFKKSLAEISTAARENLARQQRTVAADTKRLNVHGYVNEEALLGDQFRSLETQIASLQLECLSARRGTTGAPTATVETSAGGNRFSGSICPGVCAIGSDEVTLWNALEIQYDHLLRTVVNESLEDSMRVATCRLWNDDLREWEESLARFEKSLDATWCWHDDRSRGQRSSKRESTGKLKSEKNQATIGIISARERLLLNFLNKPPYERNLDTVSEIVRLSCESIDGEDTELRDTCAELWDIIITLCGIHQKSNYDHRDDSDHLCDVEHLQLVAFNALRCLEDACRRQLLHQLGVSQECTTGDELLDRLRQFCSLDGVVSFPSHSSHLWQLMYWCSRCGSPDALSALLLKLPELQHLFASQEVEIFEALGDLLIQKLRRTSRSIRANEDSIWQAEDFRAIRVGHEERSLAAVPSQIALDQLMDLLNSIRVPFYELHPILPLLLSMVNSDGPTVSLREHMPNATAEDFLWYNIHLATLKPSTSFHSYISKLQRRILQAGPQHFGSGEDVVPGRRRIVLSQYSSSCTSLISFRLQNYPAAWTLLPTFSTQVLCLQWLVYLTQFGLCGHRDSLIALLLSDLHQFIGSLSLSDAFNDIIVSSAMTRTSPESALQWCELLPSKARIGIISSIMKTISSQLFNDKDLESQILGSVGDDGSGKGGLLYRTLMTKSWDSDPSQREKEKVEARKDFERLIASLAEEAYDSGYLMSAVRLSYLISQDRSCMKFLLKVFADPTIFPLTKTPNTREVEQQKEALKFFSILESRITADKIQDLGATFEVLRIARQIVAVYQALSHNLVEEAWNLVLGTKGGVNLFPHSGLIAQWQSSELEPHIPLLIEACARCLQLTRNTAFTKGGKPALQIEGVKEKAEELLDSCTYLYHRDMSPKADTIQLLRNLAAAPQ